MCHPYLTHLRFKGLFRDILILESVNIPSNCSFGVHSLFDRKNEIPKEHRNT